jgi:hypothetical protein
MFAARNSCRALADSPGMSNVTSALDLADPFTWCDSRCDRCPVVDECEVASAMAGRGRSHEREDNGPAGWEATIEEVERDLKQSLILLGEACEREGIEFGGINPESSRPAILKLVERLGNDLVAAASTFAVAAAAHAAPGDEEGLATIVAGSVLVAIKTASVAWESADQENPNGQNWSLLSAATLLLIEHTAEQLDHCAAHLSHFVAPSIWTRFEAAMAEHEQLWRPWLANISTEGRATIAALVDAGHAPSPFSRTTRARVVPAL